MQDESSDHLLSDPHTALRRQTVATRCLQCGLHLADATSAAIGLGPTRRKRVGITNTLARNGHANDRTARAAIAPTEGKLRAVQECLTKLKAMDPGYLPLISTIQKWLFGTKVEAVERGYLVHSTCNSDTVAEFKNLGMWWRPAKRAWHAGSDLVLNDALEVLAEHIPQGDVVTLTGEIQPLATWRV